jgi:hypothetical protein
MMQSPGSNLKPIKRMPIHDNPHIVYAKFNPIDAFYITSMSVKKVEME